MKPSPVALKLAKQILCINWSHHDAPGAEELARFIDEANRPLFVAAVEMSAFALGKFNDDGEMSEEESRVIDSLNDQIAQHTPTP